MTRRPAGSPGVPVVDAGATWRLGTGPARRAAHAAAIRDWLSQQWEDATQGLDASRIALAWVGSHARAEGGPCSDLDLVLVHDRGHQAPGLAELSDRLWYPLWDNGIRFDHAVRTVAECRSVASTDLAAAVGLLDLAFVAGDPAPSRSSRLPVRPPHTAGARPRAADWPMWSRPSRRATSSSVTPPTCWPLTSKRPGVVCATWWSFGRSLRPGWPTGRTGRATRHTNGCWMCATRSTS